MAAGGEAPKRSAPGGSSGLRTARGVLEDRSPSGGRRDRRPRFDIGFGGADRRRGAARPVLRGPADPSLHRGDPDEIRVLVVGCIHGDECAGVRIARRPRRHLGPDLWILPSLNPDGRAAHAAERARRRPEPLPLPLATRTARPLLPRRPASERETRIAMRLIRRIEPDITIWFHQPLALVDASGDVTIERRYARLVGLPLVHLEGLHGTATSWQNHVLGHRRSWSSSPAVSPSAPSPPVRERRVPPRPRVVPRARRTVPASDRVTRDRATGPCGARPMAALGPCS